MPALGQHHALSGCTTLVCVACSSIYNDFICHPQSHSSNWGERLSTPIDTRCCHRIRIMLAQRHDAGPTEYLVLQGGYQSPTRLHKLLFCTSKHQSIAAQTNKIQDRGWCNPSKQKTLTQCCFNVGPPSSTLAQH